MMAYCKFVIIVTALMSVGFLSPKPLNDHTVNPDKNEFPKDSICHEANQKMDRPPRRKPRILNGRDVPCTPSVGEPPWLNWIVSISTEVSRTQTKRTYEDCGGTLISRKHVLTALHCVSFTRKVLGPNWSNIFFKQPVEPEKILIYAKSLRARQGIMLRAEEIFYKNNSIVKRENAVFIVDGIIVDDIALIKLKTEIPKDVSVNPISLPIRPLRDDDDYWLAGWGAHKTYPKWVFPDNLKQFLQAKKDKAKCHIVAGGLLGPIDKYLCFHKWNYHFTSRGTCDGDSGSPGVISILNQTSNELEWYLQGIVSSGYPVWPSASGLCNETHTYGVDMNVWHYKDDILEWMER